MADAYLDHGAYASNLGTTPTWGIPQEGDGSATTPAAASSIASIVLPGQPSAGNLLTICGITLGASSGGTHNYAIGATLNDTVNNIVSAINTNSGFGAATVSASVAHGLPRVCNLMFARNVGGTTVEIMMRVGSASLNHATNSSVGISSSGWSPTITQFAGGSGGCWGWFMNVDAALGVSGSIAIRSYGMFFDRPMVLPYALSEYDSVVIRTGRSVVLSIGRNNIAPNPTRWTNINYVFDDGTAWVGDPTDGKFTINYESDGASFGLNGANTHHFTSIVCRRRGGLTIRPKVTGPYYLGLFVFHTGYGQGFHLERVSVVEQAHIYPTFVPFPGTTASYPAGRADISFVDCLFDFSAVSRPNLVSSFLSIHNGSTPPNIQFIDNEFKFALTGVGGAALTVPFVRLSGANTVALIMRGNTFDNGAPGELTAFSSNSFAPGSGTFIHLENNRGIGVPAGATGLSPSLGLVADSATVIVDQLGVGGSAKYETRRGYAEFVNGQPTVASVAPDGVPWSWRISWTNGPLVIAPSRPWPCPVSRVQSRLATGVRTWAIELLVDSVAEAQLPAHAIVEVNYVGSDGKPRMDLVPVSLLSSSEVWSNVGAPPYNTWIPKRISGVTTSAVLVNSVINIRLVLNRSVSGASGAEFVIGSPEPALS